MCSVDQKLIMEHVVNTLAVDGKLKHGCEYSESGIPKRMMFRKKRLVKHYNCPCFHCQCIETDHLEEYSKEAKAYRRS